MTKERRAPTTSEIEQYLKSVMGSSARLVGQKLLVKPGKEGAKGYGYGTPILLELEVEGVRRRAVLRTVRPGPFGHEHMSDRAQGLLWEHGAFNTLPRHVRSLDVGAFRHDGTSVSLGSAEEFFALTDYGEGMPYAGDLERIGRDGDILDRDLLRADALCDYLAGIHAVVGPDPGHYVRRIRELLGHSECIMGIVDSYVAADQVATPARLATIEKHCIDWRWKLKPRTHRLRMVHGDFHPWNILFAEGVDFCLLDRSRGEWGDPADDVASLTINYLFFSLQRSGQIEGPFKVLFERFWSRYLEKTNDKELLEVVAPFLVFRALVMANPLWYPQISRDIRESLFRFMEAILVAKSFDPGEVGRYCSV